MISSAATPATGEPRNGRGESPQASMRGQPDGVEPLPDRRDVLDPDPVVLDVLAVGDVGGVAGEVRADRCRARARRRRRAAAPSERTRIMKNSSSSSSSSSIAVLPPSKPGRALGVEAHPAEPAAQVGGVDRGEAALGVDVEDPVADVERVVVLLGLLVLVQRLAVAERPLTLAALGARDLGVARAAVAWKRRSDMGTVVLR